MEVDERLQVLLCFDLLISINDMIFKLVCNIINAKSSNILANYQILLLFCSFLGLKFNYSPKLAYITHLVVGFGGISLPDFTFRKRISLI